ncbi:MAG: SPFH domain-containing protein [Coriobacteriales bacterium]|jgi:membrane protease subunit (stomatin/prohibitin family)|nr:SPFH domain-containing protein [Coriobacteriales bacterium]
MGFIQAFTGALGGSFADQWKDFYTVPQGVSATAGVVPALQQQQNLGRGSDTKGSENIITNGSTIVVPEGFGLVTFESGAITGFIAQPGGYTFTSTDLNAQSFFSGGGLVEAVIKQRWERFKYGGQPGSQQAAFFVNLKEIPDNKFGTQSEIYWDDAYLQTQVGAITRGSYTLKITDPILFIRGFVPVEFITAGTMRPFDFADFDNKAAEQLFNEVVASLSAAFSSYTNDPDKGNRITRIQQDAVGFADTLDEAVEEGYHWKRDRGLEIIKAALLSIEYDEDTKLLLSDVRKADALTGQRGNSFLQQSVARGVEAAGDNPNGGAMGMAFMGMGMNAAGGMAQGLQQQPDAQAGMPPAASGGGQPSSPEQSAPAPTGAPVENIAAPAAAPAADADPYEQLTKLKGLLDNGIITQEDFDKKKTELLGL